MTVTRGLEGCDFFPEGGVSSAGEQAVRDEVTDAVEDGGHRLIEPSDAVTSVLRELVEEGGELVLDQNGRRLQAQG